MQLSKFGEQLNTPIVLCLGYFGCMHLGHVELVNVAKIRADRCNAKVALFTFTDNTFESIGKPDKAIYTFEERLSLYALQGIDYVLSAEFDEEFRNNTGAQFAERLKQYELKGVVCGFDYSYGRDKCDPATLREQMANVCGVDVVAPVCRNGIKVSTTYIRKLLGDNDILTVNELLSEPYFVMGEVVHGRGVGTTIGFPTANIAVSADKFLPCGVYAGRTKVDDTEYSAIVNIGQRPTFELSEPCVEAHLSGFDGNLYGRCIKVNLTKFLRPIRKFSDEQELARQLQADKEGVK